MGLDSFLLAVGGILDSSDGMWE